MNRIILTLSLVLAFVHNVYAQQDSIVTKSSELSEVIIESKRIVHHNNYDSYLPSMLQKKHAANGLDLLHIIRLPRIHVDQVEMTVKSLVEGEVQIRIDNVPSTVSDLQALTVDRVLCVDYISTPGLKYGKGVAAVINIKTRRENVGVAYGLNAMNALTTSYNDDNVWLKFTSKQSEFGVRYNFKQNSNEKVKTISRQHFIGDGNGAIDVEKEGKYSNSHYTSHDVTLSYNITNNKKRVFDAKLSTCWNGFPDRYLIEHIIDNRNQYEMTTFNKNNEKRPMLKLYYGDAIGNNTISVYLAAAYASSTYDRSVNASMLKNSYNVKGEKYSSLGEINFSHSFTNASELSIGYQQTGEFTNNQYKTEREYFATMHNDSQYLFAAYNSKLQEMSLILSAGVSREHFNGENDKYTFWSFRPNIIFNYSLSDKMILAYSYERSTSVPKLAQLTEFTRLDNKYEQVVGNSNLKPFTTDRNEVKLNYDLGKTYFSLSFNYDYSHKMICDAPVSLSNGIYTYSFWNGANKHHFNFSFYAEQYLFDKKFFIYVMPYMVRDIMTRGIKHTNSYCSVKAGCSIYWGNFNIDFDYSSSSEDLTGETLLHNFASNSLCVGYKYRNLSVKCGMKNLFRNSGTGSREDYLSNIAFSCKEIRNYAFGNMLYLALSWNLSSGKKHIQQKVKTSNANLDTGIIK